MPDDIDDIMHYRTKDAVVFIPAGVVCLCKS